MAVLPCEDGEDGGPCGGGVEGDATDVLEECAPFTVGAVLLSVPIPVSGGRRGRSCGSSCSLVVDVSSVVFEARFVGVECKVKSECECGNIINTQPKHKRF